ncbi:MAG: cyclic nucleotide-binding domain-containing protein [Pseudomonadota bacterium]
MASTPAIETTSPPAETVADENAAELHSAMSSDAPTPVDKDVESLIAAETSDGDQDGGSEPDRPADAAAGAIEAAAPENVDAAGPPASDEAATPDKRSADDVCFLRGVAVFGALVASKRKDIAEAFERRRYIAGETIYTAGDYDGREAVVVISGGVQVHAYDEGLGEMATHVMSAGDVFGLEHCFANTTALAERTCLVAQENAEIAVIGGEKLDEFIEQSKDLVRALLTFFADRLVSGESTLAVGPEARIVGELMTYAEPDPEIRGRWRIPKTPKHRAVAEAAGVDDAAVAGVIARLIQDGVAERDYPGLVIMNYDEMRTRAGQRV